MNLQTYEESKKEEGVHISDPEKYLNHRFYIYAMLVPILFGTRALAQEKTYADPYWIFWIEGMFILLIWFGLTLALYLYIGCSRISLFNFFFRYLTIFNTKRVIVLAIISGVWLAAGNFLLILAFEFNTMSEGSQTPLNWILLANSLICLWFSFYFFNEHHAYRQYLGGIIIFVAAILLTTERSFELSFVVSIYKNAYFIVSLILGVVSCFLTAVTVICGKYSMYYYDADPVEFGVLSMIFAGIIAAGSIVKVVLSSEVFITDPTVSPFYTVIRIGFIGLLHTLGYLIFHKASSIGTLGTTQLFYNWKVAVILLEEFLIIGIIPGVTKSSTLIFGKYK